MSETKNFPFFFVPILKSKLNFEHFEKKDDRHRFCNSEITDSENALIYISKNSRFSGAFEKQHDKRAQALLNSASHHFYHIDQSLPRKLSWKNSLVLTCQILGLLFNTLATDEKYLVLHRDN